MRSSDVCPHCDTPDAIRLPDPAAGQSMTSDWRPVPTPLGKFSCTHCGLAYRDPQLPDATDFGSGYELYAHPPNQAAEQQRQSRYAAWIARVAGRASRVLDVGCGNGSLLLALRERWPEAELMGCDPSPAGVQYALAEGLTAWAGTVAEAPPQQRSELVVSVNVIEHTADPRAFVAALADSVSDDGKLVLICPDGQWPGLELLIADHRFSFGINHLESFITAAGLSLRQWSRAPRELGAFQMVVASRAAEQLRESDKAGTTRGDTNREREGEGPAPHRDGHALLASRERYLIGWQQLDARLVLRLPNDVVCFGAGEAASLLRAYAPGVWSRVRLCATDDGGSAFGDRPHLPLKHVPSDATVLVGVRPRDQAAVAERLRSRGGRVITWYDLVPDDDD